MNLLFYVVFVSVVLSSTNPPFPQPPESYYASGPWQLPLNGTIINGTGTYASSIPLQRRVEHLIGFGFGQQWYFDWKKAEEYGLISDAYPTCLKFDLPGTSMPLRWKCFLEGAVYQGRHLIPVVAGSTGSINGDFWKSSLSTIAVSPTNPNQILFFHHHESNLMKLFHSFVPLDDSKPQSLEPFFLPLFECLNTNYNQKIKQLINIQRITSCE